MDSIEITRRFLKERLQRDSATFYGFTKERNHVKDLFSRAAKGESNSALLIGPKESGKTALVNSILLELMQDDSFANSTILIHLNGLIHTNERIALKSLARQMNLREEDEERSFSSFSESFTFLLSCLKRGTGQPLICIIEEFDRFCAHHNQTLLYNLFDVAQSAQTPICVLGLTHRLDVVELLEKRVKSRFSHRQISLLPDSVKFESYLNIAHELLRLPTASVNLTLAKNALQNMELPLLRKPFNPASYEFTKEHINKWNKSVDQLVNDKRAVTSFQKLFDFNATIAALKTFLFQIVSNSNLGETHPRIEPADVAKLVEVLTGDDTVKMITGLSVLEMCLLIAIKHHVKIYDDAFNFEIIFARFTEFAGKSAVMQNINRSTVMKRFENLKLHELIAPIGIEGKVQKEYQMHQLLIYGDEIDKAVKIYQNLPTEIEQWAKSSLI